MRNVASLLRTKKSLTRSEHTVLISLTNASVLLCSCRLVSASLRVAACCSATICAWALDAAAPAVFNASWLTASSPSSRRHSAWLCRRCSPVCEKGILKQGSIKVVCCFELLYVCWLFWRSDVNVNFFSQLGRNPCMSNYLSQGQDLTQVSRHSQLLFVYIFSLDNGKSLLGILNNTQPALAHMLPKQQTDVQKCLSFNWSRTVLRI